MMKKICIIFIVHILLSQLWGWGGLAHKIITEQAMQNLPQDMPVGDEWKTYIIAHCSDPDKRKDETPGEFEKHFIDIDFYDEFERGEIVTSQAELIKSYGEEKVTEMGLLPWAIWDSYQNLQAAFAAKNKADILLYASDLAHYVEDGSQPLHVVLNYDGKLTDQDGIHRRYETKMLYRYESKIRENLQDNCGQQIEVNLDYIFAYIADTHSLAPVIFSADLHALQFSEEYDSEYYQLLWFKTKYITEIQINRAAEVLASLIYSAWVEAGRPEIG